jgi:serine/threonine-protein kinase
MIITDPAEFYGRAREIRRIYSRLSTTRPQCLSIIGERKIGKSSLLHFLAHTQNVNQHLDTPEHYAFVLVDLQGKGDWHPAGFFELVSDTIKAQIDNVPDLPTESTNGQANFYEYFRKLIQVVGQKKVKLILLLDEFEAIGRNTAFDLPFFSFLRSIANNNDVAYVTTSRQDLQKICDHAEVRESPFFNIFTPIPLGGFPDAEARQLIQEPSAQAGAPFGEPETEFILDLAGNHPFFLQIACDKTFDEKNRNSNLSQRHYDAIKPAFFSEANNHFDSCWGSASPDERDVFLRIVQGEEIETARQYVLMALEKKGYVVRGPEGPYLFSSGFEDYAWNRSPRAGEARPPGGRRKNRPSAETQPSVFGKLRNLFRRP